MATISKIAFKGVTYNLKAQGGVDSAELDKKVDKETGKGLSTNDYTTEEKTKLANIEEGANKTVCVTKIDNALSQQPATVEAITNYIDKHTSFYFNDEISSEWDSFLYDLATLVIANVKNNILYSCFMRGNGLPKFPESSLSAITYSNNYGLIITNSSEHNSDLYMYPNTILGNTTIPNIKFIHLRDNGGVYELYIELHRPEVQNITDSIAVDCGANKIYSGTNINTLTITTKKTVYITNSGFEEILIFTVGDTPAITITGVSWANSDIPTFKAGKTYEIHIVYNATIDKFLATYAVYE